MRFALGVNRPVGQPYRKWNFIDLKTPPLHALATFTPAVWRTELLGAAIIPHSFLVLHDHRTPRFTIVRELDFLLQFQDMARRKIGQ